MFDSRQENPTYVHPDHQARHYKDLHDRVFSGCTHHRGESEIIEEAEHVIVLKQEPRPYHPQGLIHVWVYTEVWSSCTTYSPSVWDNLPMPDKMATLQERLKFLKTLTP